MPAPTEALVGLARALASDFAAFADALESAGERTGNTRKPQVRGHRQDQIVHLDGMSTEEGMTTGEIHIAIDYDQPNVWLTLRALQNRAIVEQVSTVRPQRWRLTSTYRRPE